MYRVLITGATGFVGRNLMKYLGSVGYEVDTLSKQEFMAEDFKRLDDFQLIANTKMIDQLKVEIQKIDEFTGSAQIREGYYAAGNHPDIVVHCAWPKLGLHKTDHLEFAEATCNFYNECKQRGIRVINIGSSSEYGIKNEPMKEDMICEPINTYGIAKLMVTLFAKKLGYNTLRLFTVTGEGGHSFFDNQEKWDKWEHPFSNRTTIPVELVAKAVERLMHAEHVYGEIINCGTDNERSYKGWQSDFNLNPESKWLKAPQTQYEPRRWACDTTKMKQLLNLI